MNGEAIEQEEDECFGVASLIGFQKGGLNAHLQHSIYMRFQRVVVLASLAHLYASSNGGLNDQSRFTECKPRPHCYGDKDDCQYA